MKLRITGISAALAVAACSGSQALLAPDVPAPLRAPLGEELYLETLAVGVQIYECTPSERAPTGFAWTFRAPEATLLDHRRAVVGKHYGGPTWEALDGSAVVAEVHAKSDAPDAKSIPWLLLGMKSRSGSGTFDAVTSIQRVATEGGLAPSVACEAGRAGEKARMPYKATYYFYRRGRAA